MAVQARYKGFDKIRLKRTSCDIDFCLEKSSSFVVEILTEKSFPFGNWERFNSIVKNKRTVAFFLRWLPSHKHFRSSILETSDPCEMEIAEQKLIYLSQDETFPSELKLLRSGKLITRNSRIAKYSPFIGPADIFRSTVRISRLVNCDFDSQHPIILDARQAIVRLLVRHVHLRKFHQGLDYMRAVVNLKYVLLNLQWLLRNIENTCVACRKRKAQTVSHIMTDLPIERLGYPQPPFSNTGVDYFGLFLVPIRRSTEKRWGFLFTCLTTRAVHIEVVPSLDTSSCVMGVKTFLQVAVLRLPSCPTTARTFLVLRKSS